METKRRRLTRLQIRIFFSVITSVSRTGRPGKGHLGIGAREVSGAERDFLSPRLCLLPDFNAFPS